MSTVIDSSPKQRKRARPSPSPSYDGDVIHVVRPRAKSPVVLILSSQRPPLEETITRGNIKKRRRIATHVDAQCAVSTQTARPPHVPAWKRLGLALKPRPCLRDALTSKENAISTRAFRNYRIAPPVGDSFSDDTPPGQSQNSCEDSDTAVGPGSDDVLEGRIEEDSPVARRAQSPLLNVRSAASPDDDATIEAQLTVGGQDTMTDDIPSSRLRRRTARVSYVLEPVRDSLEDVEDETVSDDYWSTAAGGESDSDNASDSSLRSSLSVNETSVTEEAEETIDVIGMESEPKQAKLPHTPKAGKSIDQSLPPLDNVEDIFADIASRVIDPLQEALRKFDHRPLNIATMCSGTESPLIAFELLSKGLETHGSAPIRVKHHFSVEIDVVKQGYIERNFRPTKLFRDVRDFIGEDATTATTAYGAQELIPGQLDMLIAGFVCKDLSRLNNHQKGLEDGGESGDTWSAIYSYTKRFRPSIVLIENVQHTHKFWNDFKSKWTDIGYEYAWKICDTKNYYIPQTRNRMYMIAIERSHFGGGVKQAVEEWKDWMMKLQRQCSSPFDAFLRDDISDQYEYSNLGVEPNWALCKLRYDQIRSEQRLGIRRPLTRWSENGTVRPPDFANHKWYDSQSSRVYDCIDIAHLQAAQRGEDSQYKMAIWDVSQNVDRFKASLGLVPCITPNGCDFVSNRHTALTGSQLMLLQGMPSNKLLFAKETQKDLQDLAGNAMTTTVIGASIVSALICASKAFGRNSTQQSEKGSDKTSKMSPTFVTPKPMINSQLAPANTSNINISELIEDATYSSRMCNCEGAKSLSQFPVNVCTACGHTACSRCAGNPSHSYGPIVSKDERRQRPAEFQRKWRPTLPSRLKLSGFPGATVLKAHCELSANKDNDAFVRHVIDVDVGSQHFSINRFDRLDNLWRITYESTQATLELLISHQVQWHLRVKCPSSEPGNSALRRTLRQPLARGIVHKSLLEPLWEIFIPRPESVLLNIAASQESHSSWRSRLGLPDHKEEIMPTHLDVKCQQRQLLSGKYILLPHCGTAMSSLYKRVSKEGDGPLYLFLDPDPVGPSSQDAFTFSEDCHRLQYGSTRLSRAHLDPSWRPCTVGPGSVREVKAIDPGIWVPSELRLKAASSTMNVSIPSASALSATVTTDCLQSPTILDLTLADKIELDNFSQYAWALEHAKVLPSFNDWQGLNTPCAGKECTCAPTFPRVLWSINRDGSATAHEDRKAAAVFERKHKTRCRIFNIVPSTSSEGSRVQVGLNILSMVHRARKRLKFANASAWRLVTDHAEPALEPFPKFKLRSNTTDAPFSDPLRLKYILGESQRRSLTWMKSQETGKTMTVVEVEEAIHSELAWRAEAKAEAEICVRGGVLADLPSFGKTVTTIALIHSEFEKHDPDGLLAQNQKALRAGLIQLPATLIICPPHIAQQWNSELKGCLGQDLHRSYEVRLVEDYSDLRSLSIEDFRSSRVIIVSWNVFADNAYISQLATFAAMPPPASGRGRAFNAWLKYVSEKVPSQVQSFLRLNDSEFDAKTANILAQRLAHVDFQAVVPLKIAHGSAYQSYKSMDSTSATQRSKPRTTTKKRARSASPESGLASRAIPLLHLFDFNRIVIDEYHYLYDGKKPDNLSACAAIKELSATKRWILSGTPSLRNFSDVSQIASFLGVKLGRDVAGDGITTTELEKRMFAEQTDVEKFLSRTETMSYQWHQARHEQAQAFLDRFVRQNEPSLQHIPCAETLRPIELGIAHHAVYLELSQHLISQRMQIKRLRSNKSGSDRVDRLIVSLNNSATAEEALINAALLFETKQGKSGLETLAKKRQQQQTATKDEISSMLHELKHRCLKKLHDSREDHYQIFKRDMELVNLFGDEDTRQIVLKIIREVEKDSNAQRTSRRTASATDLTALKELASAVRASIRDLTIMIRSSRFISTIQGLLQAVRNSTEGSSEQTCNSPQCTGDTKISQLFLISHCGHLACEACLRERMDSETCVSKGCEVPVQPSNLIRASDIGSSQDEVSDQSFGKKLDAMSMLLKSIPKPDQAIMFVPNNEVAGVMVNVLSESGISYHSLGTKKTGAARILEDFKNNADPEERKQVLILNLKSESAAGANLVNANHIIFVSPLLAKSQFEYDSAMAQAVARCRRYGQKKKVHIYHFAALRTIDVDILEHRHKCFDALRSDTTPMRSPPKSKRKEKSKMIRNTKGTVALVPLSWLTNDSFREMIEVDKEDPGSFTSLVNFSETFEGGGDDE